jgi:hypothetical protein
MVHGPEGRPLDRGGKKGGAAAGEGPADSACQGAATRSSVGGVLSCAAIATSTIWVLLAPRSR